MGRAVLLLAALLAVATAACGGAGDEPPTAAAPATRTASTETPPATATESEPGETETPATATEGEQGETESAVTADATTPETETEPPAPRPLPGLPRYTAGYKRWTKLNAEPIPPSESDPHLGTKNVYASEKAGPDGVYPVGTIIVKDAVRPDADFIGLVAVMRKRAGFDPAHNDWEFIEWTRESADAPFTITARDEVCTGCHIGAEDDDYVWIAALDLTR